MATPGASTTSTQASVAARTSHGDAAPRYQATALRRFATELLVGAGASDDIAADVASILVEGDLMEHTTHGLALLAGYLDQLAQGSMRGAGEPHVVHQATVAQTWDGRRLPGPWLTLRALDACGVMASRHGTGTVVIRRSHHIACLATYARRAADRGVMALVYCSDPSNHSVAPFGAVTSVFTPNPLAAGIPTSGDPILLDVSASYTTNGLTTRLYQSGGLLAHPWVQDAKGNPTRDPSVLFQEPKGTLLPLGGLEAGHKGFALALLIEAMTAGLTGHGRADPSEGWGATVFVQVLDPALFGGRDAFVRQMDWLVTACHGATPRQAETPVRLPGERALARWREQEQSGIALHPSIMPALAPWAERLQVATPQPSSPPGGAPSSG